MRLVSMDNQQGIARHLAYLKPVLLVRGAFSLRPLLPPQDVALVGARVNLVLRRDVRPAVLYALLQAMREVHKGQTLISAAGDFPQQAGAALPVHPQAQDWARSGTPWIYEHLSPSNAGLLDACWRPLLALVTLASVFSSLQSIQRLVDGATLAVAQQVLAWLNRRLLQGRTPGWWGRVLFRLAEPVIVRQEPGQIARERLERLERLRPHVLNDGRKLDPPRPNL